MNEDLSAHPRGAISGLAGNFARRTEAGDAARRFGYMVAIAFNGLCYYVAHNLLSWNLPFVTEAWSSVLWAVDLSIAAAVAVNVVQLFYDPRWLRHLSGAVSGGFAFLATYVIWQVYPFDFGETWNDAAQLVLVFMLVVTVIGIVVQSVQMVFALGSGD